MGVYKFLSDGWGWKALFLDGCGDAEHWRQEIYSQRLNAASQTLQTQIASNASRFTESGASLLCSLPLLTHLLQAPESNCHWKQDTEEVTLLLSVPKQIGSKDVQLTIHPKRLDLVVDGRSLLSGSLEDVGEVNVDGEQASAVAPRLLGCHLDLRRRRRRGGRRCHRHSHPPLKIQRSRSGRSNQRH